jgi:hypothetical protein
MLNRRWRQVLHWRLTGAANKPPCGASKATMSIERPDRPLKSGESKTDTESLRYFCHPDHLEGGALKRYPPREYAGWCGK